MPLMVESVDFLREGRGLDGNGIDDELTERIEGDFWRPPTDRLSSYESVDMVESRRREWLAFGEPLTEVVEGFLRVLLPK